MHRLISKHGVDFSYLRSAHEEESVEYLTYDQQIISAISFNRLNHFDLTPKKQTGEEHLSKLFYLVFSGDGGRPGWISWPLPRMVPLLTSG